MAYFASTFFHAGFLLLLWFGFRLSFGSRSCRSLRRFLLGLFCFGLWFFGLRSWSSLRLFLLGRLLGLGSFFLGLFGRCSGFRLEVNLAHHLRPYLWDFGFDFYRLLAFFLGFLLFALFLSLLFLSSLAQFFSFVAEVLIGLKLFLHQGVLFVRQLRIGVYFLELVTFLFQKVDDGLHSDVEFFDNFI